MRQTLAADRGQPLQSLLLGLLTQRADVSHSRELLIEDEADFARHGGGVDAGPPPAGDVVRAARREAGRA